MVKWVVWHVTVMQGKITRDVAFERSTKPDELEDMFQQQQLLRMNVDMLYSMLLHTNGYK